jgi:hypothetical protein
MLEVEAEAEQPWQGRAQAAQVVAVQVERKTHPIRV